MKIWAAVTVEPDGIAVYIHNWLRIGLAKSPEELWKLVHEGWDKPEEFWRRFAAERPARSPLADLSFEDLFSEPDGQPLP